MVHVALIVAGLLELQSAAAPQATPPSTNAPATQSTPQPVRRICENRAPTGSRLERRICYTPEQLATMIREKRKEAEELTGGGNLQNDRAVLGGS